MEPSVSVVFAEEKHVAFVRDISRLIDEAASTPSAGIARRAPEYLQTKILEGKAVIALTPDSRIAGFCYIETWSDGRYVANSGLIVSPEFRSRGLGKVIKQKIFELSRIRFPEAKIFGLTTNPAVMKINTELGYKPVPFSDLTGDEQFWDGCRGCANHDILIRMNRTICLCTGMLFEPKSDNPE